MMRQLAPLGISTAATPRPRRLDLSAARNGVVVERIDTLEAFDRIRQAFEEVYARDTRRNVFISWAWLRAYVESMADGWCVLAARVRGDGRYVGFCFLEVRRVRFGPVALDTELYFGVNPTADYCALLLDGGLDQPGEQAVIHALASTIELLPWDNFRINNVCDPRVAAIVDRLRTHQRVEVHAANRCRYLVTAPTWELFLNEQQSYAGRRRLRYVRRGFERLPGFRFEEATAIGLDRCVDALLQLNHQRWQTNLEKARQTYGALFRAGFVRGCCRLFVVWSGDTPVAAQAAFVDPERRSWGVYMLGYNAEYARHSPGTGIIILTLQRAIEEGYREYDFLRGDEPYKERFGATVRMLENWTVRRNGLRNRLVRFGRAVYYRTKALARKVLLGKPLSTSAYDP